MRHSIPILVISISALTISAASAFAQATGTQQGGDTARQIVVEPQKPAGESTPAAAPAAAEAKPETPAAPAAAAPAAVVATPAAKEEPAKVQAVAPVAPAVVAIPPEQVVIVLQQELARVGCYLYTLDGAWGPRSHAALEAFAHFGKIANTDFAPSANWIGLVKAKTEAVCPPNYAYTPHYPPYYGPRRGYGGGYHGGGGGYYGGGGGYGGGRY